MKKDRILLPFLHPSSLRKAGRQGSMAMDTGSCLIEIHDPFSVGPGGMQCEIGRKLISWRREPRRRRRCGFAPRGTFSFDSRTNSFEKGRFGTC